jgi:Rrf2 family transcriptional regulator, cysteine metabolism repressor
LLTISINKHTLGRENMRLSAASEYGCLALLAIAESHPEWCKRQQVSERFPIPTSFLEQILRKLTSAGIVVSRRGANGGFRLARPAGEILIAEVVRTMDGALAPTRSVSPNFYQSTPVEASHAYTSLFRRVRDAVADILESTTLEDIVNEERNTSRTARRKRGRAVPPTRSRPLRR